MGIAETMGYRRWERVVKVMGEGEAGNRIDICASRGGENVGSKTRGGRMRSALSESRGKTRPQGRRWRINR